MGEPTSYGGRFVVAAEQPNPIRTAPLLTTGGQVPATTRRPGGGGGRWWRHRRRLRPSVSDRPAGRQSCPKPLRSPVLSERVALRQMSDRIVSIRLTQRPTRPKARDARDALIDSGHLANVVAVETEIRILSHELGFDDPAGGSDGR